MGLEVVRAGRLAVLLEEDKGPQRGKRARLGRRLKVAPAQISQWLNGARTIDEASARKIERNAGKPIRWMDGDNTSEASAPFMAVAEPPAAYVVQHLGTLLQQVGTNTRAELVNAMSAFVLSGGQGHYLPALIGLLQPAAKTNPQLGEFGTPQAEPAPLKNVSR